MQLFSTLNDEEWCEDERLQSTLEWFSQQAGSADGSIVGTGDTDRVALGKEVRGVLYGVENLRKRPEAEAAESG